MRKLSGVAYVGVLLASSTPAHAYLDGATGSMLLQAAIGGVATAMMFGRVYLARLKSLFRRAPNAQPPVAGE